MAKAGYQLPPTLHHGPWAGGYCPSGHHFPSLPSLWRHLDALGADLADLERAMH